MAAIGFEVAALRLPPWPDLFAEAVATHGSAQGSPNPAGSKRAAVRAVMALRRATEEGANLPGAGGLRAGGASRDGPGAWVRCRP